MIEEKFKILFLKEKITSKFNTKESQYDKQTYVNNKF